VNSLCFPSRALLCSGALLCLIGLSGTAAPVPVPTKSEPKIASKKSEAPLTRENYLPRLKAAVEAAEKAIDAEDWDAASDRVDDAEELVSACPAELIASPQIAPLLDRLKAAENQLEEDEEATPEAQASEDGLRMPTEVVPLAGEDLRKELKQVEDGEKGEEYDFPIDLNDKVLTWVHLFSNEKKGFVEGSLSRATRYLPMARQIFAEEGVPRDLAYLALIESGFKNNAKSYAKAVGMWQFIPSTGRIYGLNANAWLDERMDPVRAARASARYLRRLYETSGDWYLALVGYNAGPLTTERAAQNLGTRNFWDMHRSPWLRNQTKNYVPELLAAILIGHNPEHYGLKIYPQPPYAYETVQVDRMTSLSVLARSAGTDADTLRDLNPELKRASTPPGTYALRVPPGMSQTLARVLSHLPAAQRLDFASYVVRKGDTLKSVSAHFNIQPEDLLAANGITKAKFKAGRRIQVPPPAPEAAERQDLVAQIPASMERPVDPLPQIPGASQPEAPVADLSYDTSALPPPPPPPAVIKVLETRTTVEKIQQLQSHPKSHTVKPGETLFSISSRYGIEVKDLKKWNRLKKNKINVGQKLKLQK